MSKVIDEHAKFAMLELSIHTNTLHTKHAEALRDIYTEMLLSGCGTYDRHAFLDILGNLGSSIAVFDEGNVIRVQLRARNEMLEKTLKLLTCIFEKPHFKPQELKRIQKRYVEELKLAKENASARARQNFTNSFLDVTDHRYGYDLDTVREETGKVAP
jgi:predicted Zn-dependent peptidase